MIHPSHAPFIAEIEADLADATPRMVYADWLEEHGDDVAASVWRKSNRVLMADMFDLYKKRNPDDVTRFVYTGGRLEFRNRAGTFEMQSGPAIIVAIHEHGATYVPARVSFWLRDDDSDGTGDFLYRVSLVGAFHGPKLHTTDVERTFVMESMRRPDGDD